MHWILLILLYTPDLTKCIAGKAAKPYSDVELCTMDKQAQVAAFLIGEPPEIKEGLVIKTFCLSMEPVK